MDDQRPSLAKGRDGEWTHLSEDEETFNDYEFPKVTVIVPVYNCAQWIGATLESILHQEYPSFEVVVIDGGSEDRTIEIIKSFRDDRVRIFSITGYKRYEMVNKGISQATGEYVNILFPGDFYLFKNTLHIMMELALSHDKPNVVFAGTLLRDSHGEVRVLYRHLSLKLLRRGQQPTSLQSCWYLLETFKKVGKFDTNLLLRGGYDIMCRIALHQGMRNYSTRRVLIDYSFQWVTRNAVWIHFRETALILFRYFGLLKALRWLFIQKDVSRLVKLSFRKLKVAFLGRR